MEGKRFECSGAGHRSAIWAASFLLLFTLWTILACVVDVKPAGPYGSEVGLSTVNIAFLNLTGENLALYYASDLLSLVPLLIMLGFTALGAIQLVRRKSLAEVDRDLLALGGLYAALLFTWVGFDAAALNYRPLLIEGTLEPSYPSSTTLLTMSVALTATMQAKHRLKRSASRNVTELILIAFALAMVSMRLLSGVHWLSDIIGGVLLSASFVWAYRAAAFRN